MNTKQILVTFFLLLVEISSLCAQPQKSIYISLNSISNQDHLQHLFSNVSRQSSSFYMIFEDAAQERKYELHNISYNLSYNNHYQREFYADMKAIKVSLGRVNVLAHFKFNIIDKNMKSLFSGVGYARSYLDPASFEKYILQKNGSVQWATKSDQKLRFTALWFVEEIDALPKQERHIIESMMNNIVKVDDTRPKINPKYGKPTKIYFKQFLNAQKMFSTDIIDYSYNKIQMHFLTDVKTINVDKDSQGLVAQIKFGLNDTEQIRCGSVPKVFNEKDYGGSVEYFSMEVVSFVVKEAIHRGLFNLSLDGDWESSAFQFYMGDLANAVPYANNNQAISPITITCQSQNQSNILVSRYDDHKIYVEVPSKCMIFSSQKELLQITMQLIATVKIIAQNSELSVTVNEFYPRKISQKALEPNYVVPDQQRDVAQMIISSVLNTTLGSAVFGSKMPILNRRYPAVIINEQHLIIFDFSEMSSMKDTPLEMKKSDIL